MKSLLSMQSAQVERPTEHGGELLPTSYKATLLAEADRLAAPPTAITHEKVLEDLLAQVQRLDFRQLASLDEDKDKVRTSHYVVIVVQELLALASENRWGLCRRQGFLYSYNGAYWRRLEEETLRRFLKEVAERMGVPSITARYHGFSEQLYKQFLDTASLPVAKPTGPRKTILINLLNGTFEIGATKQILRPPAAEDFITYQLPFAYDERAQAPRWQAFLNHVVPDKTCQQILAEYLGYLFIAPVSLKLEKVLLLYGSGANGKSVFFEVVKALLGPDNVSSYSLNSLTGETAYCRAHLGNALVNYTSEISSRLDPNTFKQLISGEPIEARLPYGQPFTLTDYAKFIFNCNELPTEVEHSHGFFRRFLIVPFTVTIPEAEQDKQLATNIIAEELAGIFNWMLAGLGRLLAQQRFTASSVVDQQLAQYQVRSDTVKLFLTEHEYVANLDFYQPTAEIYSQYKQFCLDYGHRYPVARLKFVERLDSVGIGESRRNTGKVLHLSRQSG